MTDHQALTTIFGLSKGVPTLAAARMQRWALILSAYCYKIQYRKSSLHANCDALSRLPIKQNVAEQDEFYNTYFVAYLPGTIEQISSATRKPPVLSKVVEFVLSGWPSQCTDPNLIPFFKRKHELSVDKRDIIVGHESSHSRGSQGLCVKRDPRPTCGHLQDESICQGLCLVVKHGYRTRADGQSL